MKRVILRVDPRTPGRGLNLNRSAAGDLIASSLPDAREARIRIGVRIGTVEPAAAATAA